MKNGKVVLVTGGLSGIGKGTVLELAKAGYIIVIFDMQDDKAEEVTREADVLGGQVHYMHVDLFSTCKHAIVELTKGAALDYAKKNITVNAITPGAIETELVTPYKKSDSHLYDTWAASNPAGRLGKPREIGRVVTFLFEEESAFINGAILPVDSGFTAGK